jgi:hypothetical protein
MSVYGHVHVPIATAEPMTYVMSGGWPSAVGIARAVAGSLPRVWLFALVLPIWVRMPELQRVLRVSVIESGLLRWM